MHRDPEDTLKVLTSILEDRTAETHEGSSLNIERIEGVLRTKFTSTEMEQYTETLKSVRIPVSVNTIAFDGAALSLLMNAVEFDNTYDEKIKDGLCGLMETYSPHMLRTVIWVLQSFVRSKALALTPRITYGTLTAFYRKAVELNASA
jgi:hypothetical protein